MFRADRILPTMVTPPFNVGIVGYGSSAKTFHIPLITCVAELRLYAVVQRNPTAENNAEKDLPGIKSYRSTEDMVGDEAIDVVVVTTIPETHFELVKLALANGKHGTMISNQACGCISLLNMISCGGKAIHAHLQGGRGTDFYCEEVRASLDSLSK